MRIEGVKRDERVYAIDMGLEGRMDWSIEGGL